MLPLPPGVIVLRPGGVVERREDLNACPEGFKEVTHYRWRFCQTLRSTPEPIPAHLLNLPVAGVPYEKAKEIVKRNLDWLLKLPGVRGVGLGADGVTISTDIPAVVPSDVEGLPVKIEPAEEYNNQNHTTNSPIRPLHGAVSIADPSWATPTRATGTAIVLSQGKPWMISVAHMLNNCENDSCAG